MVDWVTPRIRKDIQLLLLRLVCSERLENSQNTKSRETVKHPKHSRP